MPGTVYVRGGFNTGLPDASDSLRRRMAQADAEYERKGALQAEERQARAEYLAESSIAASVHAAEERGDLVTRQDRMHGRGRTPAEAVAYFSAQQDIEDMRRQAETLRKFREWEQGEADLDSADTTAPTAEERGLQAAREHDLMVQRSKRFRHREAVDEAVQTVRRQLFRSLFR